MEWSSRTELLIGKEALDKLSKKHVLVIGLGGVGAYAAENICRAGVGEMTIVDGDKIVASNRNRQLLALTSTEGKSKAILMKERLLEINPDIIVNAVDEYIINERIVELLNQKYDYVVDAIDTLSPKIYVIVNAMKNKLPLVSSMGAGGKIDPAGITVSDISKSYNCMLARALRKRLHKLGIRKGFKVVFSNQLIEKELVIPDDSSPNKKSIIGTMSYMPALFGCYCASVVIQDLIED